MLHPTIAAQAALFVFRFILFESLLPGQVGCNLLLRTVFLDKMSAAGEHPAHVTRVPKIRPRNV